MTEKQANRIYMRKYRRTLKNKKYVRAYFKKYYKRNYARKAKNERQRRYRKAHGYPKRNFLKWFTWYIKYTYNLSIEQYEKIAKTQNFSCGICKKPQDKLSKRFAVDHDHKTGQIRGLLCHQCNAGLGNFHDNIQFLVKATAYLKRFK